MNEITKKKFRESLYESIEKLEKLAPKLNTIEIVGSAQIKNTPEGYPEGIQMEDGMVFEWSTKYKITPNNEYYIPFFDTIQKISKAINSKDGALMLPRGLYRMLMKFSDDCVSRMKWKNAQSIGIFTESDKLPPKNETVMKHARKQFDSSIRLFMNVVSSIKREILFFENEKDENEESFFGQ